jgi:hypothetical protein
MLLGLGHTYTVALLMPSLLPHPTLSSFCWSDLTANQNCLVCFCNNLSYGISVFQILLLSR